MPLLELNERSIEAALIVFDKDGVLLDFNHLWARVTEARVSALCAGSGLDLAPALMRLLGLDAAGRVVPDGLLAGGTRHESTLASATALHQAGLSWQRARAIAFEAFESAAAATDLAELARPLPGVVATVRALHRAGWKLAIATTDQTPGALRFLAECGLEDCFSAVVGADQVARSKPAPDLFLAACERSGVAPGRAVMVGDLDLDLLMARAAGAALTVGVLSGVGDRALLSPHADVVLDGVSGLVPA